MAAANVLAAIAALAGSLAGACDAASAPSEELARTLASLHDGILLTAAAPMQLQARPCCALRRCVLCCVFARCLTYAPQTQTQNGPRLQDGVARLCEAWWHADLPHKELLVAKTMPFVLMNALRRARARAHAPRAGRHAGTRFRKFKFPGTRAVARLRPVADAPPRARALFSFRRPQHGARGGREARARAARRAGAVRL
jgi:hypothetical protein